MVSHGPRSPEPHRWGRRRDCNEVRHVLPEPWLDEDRPFVAEPVEVLEHSMLPVVERRLQASAMFQ